MNASARSLYPALLVAVLSAGCQSTPPAPGVAMTDEELKVFFARAQDPRRLWLTVYKSEYGLSFSGAHRLHPDQYAVMPFISPRDSSAPVIRVKSRGVETFPALLDTSARESWVSMPAAKTMRITTVGHPVYESRPQHVADDLPGYLTVADKIKFDQLHMETALLYARAAHGPLTVLARGVEHPRPEVVLSYELLSAFRFMQIDYPGRSVVLSATSPFTPGTNAMAVAAAITEVSRVPAMEGMIDNQPATILIDTAGDYELALPETSLSTVHRLVLGELILENVTVISAGDRGLTPLPYPRVGRRLLSQFKVTFDNKMKTIYLEHPRGG